MYPSIALSPNGWPELSYQFSGAELRYAWRDAAGWHNETVDHPASGGAGYDSSLAVDDNGIPHIAYLIWGSSQQLWHAYWNTNLFSWVKEFVANAGGGLSPGRVSLALEASGNPRIAYLRADSGELRYATYDGVWTSESVSIPGCCESVSLKLDSRGIPHIVTYNYSLPGLDHLWRNGASWIQEHVDIGLGVGPSASLALDPLDQARIAYLDQISWSLKYAAQTPIGWNITTVPTSLDRESMVSLVLDSNDHPHIAYTNAPYLGYAYWNGSWRTCSVDSDSVWVYASLALDSTGESHIGYVSQTSGLKYARGARPNDPPTSSVLPISPYWINAAPVSLRANASDPDDAVVRVDLYYRFNGSTGWGPWTLYGSDAAPPWSWAFSFPQGNGRYEFHSLAYDGKDWEANKTIAEASAGYDAIPPIAIVNPSTPHWRNASTPATATVSDAISGVENATLWYRSSTDNSSWGSWRPFATNTAPPWTWPFGFPDGPGHYQFQATAFDVAGNEDPLGAVREAEVGFDPDAPSASLTVRSPSVSDPPRTWVTGATSLNLTASDGDGSGVANIRYRTWHNGWSPWSDYSAEFPMAGADGLRYLEFQALDLAGNKGLLENRTMVLDDTPPATTISPATGPFTTATTFTLSATDSGCGLDVTRYSVDGGGFTDYSGGFTLSEGNHNISYYSKDRLGNTGQTRALMVSVRTPLPPNTPPTVTLNAPAGGEEWLKGSVHAINWTMHDDQDVDANLTVYVNYTTAGATHTIVAGLRGGESFLWTLPDIEATDVVVNITVIDTGGLKGWDQSGPFTIKAPPPPSSVEANYKPVVAVIFAIILAVAGVWSSKRRPRKGGKDGMAVAKAFMFTSIPFVVAEAATGVASFITGQLSIPPAIGPGTAVDMTVLLAGIAVAVLRAVKSKTSRTEETGTSGSW